VLRGQRRLYVGARFCLIQDIYAKLARAQLDTWRATLLIVAYSVFHESFLLLIVFNEALKDLLDELEQV
jgi:hypothetical protein